MSEGKKQQPLNSKVNGSPNGRNFNRGEYYSGENMPQNEGDMEELDLQQLFGTIMRYKWWVAGIDGFNQHDVFLFRSGYGKSYRQ